MIDIKALIKQKSITKKDLAQKLGMSDEELLQAEKDEFKAFNPCHPIALWRYLEDMSRHELSVRSQVAEGRLAKIEGGQYLMTNKEKANIAIALGVEPENIAEKSVEKPSFKVEKDFMIDDYRCVVVGTSMGHRCGYVGLPKGHDLEGTAYGLIDVDVHGGLTFGREHEDYPVENKEKRWYIGFDCAHCYDIIDTELIGELLPEKEAEEMKAIYSPLINSLRSTPGGHLWTSEDVERELISLVEQLKNYSEKMDVI